MRRPITKPVLLLTAAATALLTTITVLSLQPAQAQLSPQDRLLDNLTDNQLQNLITNALEPISNTAAVKPGEAAIVADPRGGFAYFINPAGKFVELEFRLDRRTPAITIPVGGYALVRDIRDQLFLVRDSGKTRELFDE
ncbi:MAG: hypothetical protein AAF750_08740 [Planctomycetota bacterium]